ncbi:MAG: sodium:calcium antiporter [Erysipelotrichaceae bacterium]
MIYFAYALTAVLVVGLSMQAAKYVDLLDKKTDISGAFIGGILLSAVTSLPELLTTICATLWLDQPGLSIGNILGSNLFNLAVLAVLLCLSFKAFQKARIASSHTTTTYLLVAIYGMMFLNVFGLFQGSIFHITMLSFFIFGIYVIGVKVMANDTMEAEDSEAEIACSLSVKQIGIRFALTSLALVVSSILITYFTDLISIDLNLGAGMAGAIFLGIATSLPEVTSSISLIRMKNFNVAIGSILGSNLFNFLVLCIADVLYVGGSIYLFSDVNTLNLLFFGALATPLTLVLLGRKRYAWISILSGIGVLSCYLFFLIV